MNDNHANAMGIPRVRFFKKQRRVHDQAQHIWLILACHVDHTTRPITYEQLQRRMNITEKIFGEKLDRPLAAINSYCLSNDLPPLNVIVINPQTGQPGSSFTMPANAKDVGGVLKQVHNTDWLGIFVPAPGAFRKAWNVINKGVEDGND